MGEFEGSDEAGLSVQAAEVTAQIDIDDGILFLEGFIRQGVIDIVENLFALVGSQTQVNHQGILLINH